MWSSKCSGHTCYIYRQNIFLCLKIPLQYPGFAYIYEEGAFHFASMGSLDCIAIREAEHILTGHMVPTVLGFGGLFAMHCARRYACTWLQQNRCKIWATVIRGSGKYQWSLPQHCCWCCRPPWFLRLTIVFKSSNYCNHLMLIFECPIQTTDHPDDLTVASVLENTLALLRCRGKD